MDLRTVLTELHAALDEASIEHAVIGGLALAVHGAARATIDLDFIADGDRDGDLDAILMSHGFQVLHRSEHVANYVSADPARGRVDFLLARRMRGRAILRRATSHALLGRSVRVVDAADLIGLKVQGYANDPRRRNQDLADIARVLENGQPDMARVREYFQLFDREKELDALLASEPPR